MLMESTHEKNQIKPRILESEEWSNVDGKYT